MNAFGGKNTFSLILCLDSVQVSGTKVANMKSYLPNWTLTVHPLDILAHWRSCIQPSAALAGGRVHYHGDKQFSRRTSRQEDMMHRFSLAQRVDSNHRILRMENMGCCVTMLRSDSYKYRPLYLVKVSVLIYFWSRNSTLAWCGGCLSPSRYIGCWSTKIPVLHRVSRLSCLLCI